MTIGAGAVPAIGARDAGGGIDPSSLTRKLTETFCRGLGGGMPAAAAGGGGGGISAAAAALALFASARAFSSRSLSRFALIRAVCCCTFFTSVPGFAFRDDFISRRSSSAEDMVSRRAASWAPQCQPGSVSPVTGLRLFFRDNPSANPPWRPPGLERSCSPRA